jgi:hypothetical protein
LWKHNWAYEREDNFSGYKIDRYTLEP